MAYSLKTLCSGFFLLLLLSGEMHSQDLNDSIPLKEVTVNAYFRKLPILRSPSSVSVIDNTLLHSQGNQTLVTAMNTAPGVRMEERSPGSYRLSLRGSLLRSPFGVRNVKVYVNEFPFTDAGGNTYLNLIDHSAIERIEVIKGPDGSLFGANSGGVVRIDLLNNYQDSSNLRGGLTGGSFGMLHEHAAVKFRIKKHSLSVSEAWQQSEGYRENSQLKRLYFHLTDNWNYSSAAEISFLFFHSRLNYRTPGALTLKEFENDPRAARPRTALFPGAAEQKAGVDNVTSYGGLLHRVRLVKRVSFVTAFFASHSNFENPFITNYEARYETSRGLRTWLETGNENQTGLRWTWNTGLETQRTDSRIMNYKNYYGEKGALQTDRQLDAGNTCMFMRFNIDLNNRFQAEASGSYNFNQYNYQDISGNLSLDKNIFTPQFMPRVATSFLINQNLAWRATVSKGYSPPTLAELLPTGTVLNKNLQPENGYNYETGLRFRTKKGRIRGDLSAFYYRLRHAIVRRVNNVGQEFFLNAGETKQRGVELEIAIDCIPQRSSGFIRHLMVRRAYTFSYFTFGDYRTETNDYSGNFLAGVPQNICVSDLRILFPEQFSFTARHNYTSSIPLNDANSEYAKSYNLVQAKTAWTYTANRKLSLELYAGVDNLLNIRYSLGNDLNAAGGRYYNAAPSRNYFVGVNFLFK